MRDHTRGISNPVEITEELEINGTNNLRQEINITKGRNSNFVCNYIELNFLFTGETDEPTEVEKLTKLNTFNIETKGSGTWKNNLNWSDIYYRYLARIENGRVSNLIGNGGGDNDLHGMKIILDAGLGAQVNSKCGWTKSLEAVLKLEFATDVGLDGSVVTYTLHGYEDGVKPTHVLAVENAEITPATAGDLYKFSVNEGEILQEFYAFLTTELNLATIQSRDDWGIRELTRRPNDQEAQKIILAYVNQMTDGINDSAEGTGQEFVRRSFDHGFDGFGIRLHANDKIAVEAGVNEAHRYYLSKLQPILAVR